MKSDPLLSNILSLPLHTAVSRSLRPWKHYVPLTHGEGVAREILGLVRRLQRDDRRARQIAETAQKWAYRCV
jgi:hypothetical protein